MELLIFIVAPKQVMGAAGDTALWGKRQVFRSDRRVKVRGIS